MEKVAVMVMVLLGACVADSDEPLPTDRDEVTVDSVDLIEQDANAGLCAAANELPTSELCSLVCDADAFKARLVDDGMKTGNCYQVRCTLAPEMSVTVGVCLP